MVDRKIKTNEFRSNKKCSFSFSPSDIKMQDDAFHESKSSRYAEWWYFDAVFDNGYSIQVAVRILSIVKKRLVIVLQRISEITKSVKNWKLFHQGNRFGLLKTY